MTLKIVATKLIEIRQLISLYSLDGYLFFINDEFNNEYVPDHLNRLKYLTGFTGSSGAVFIDKEKAIFFTDARYYLQANLELKDNFIVKDYSYLFKEFIFDGVIGFPEETINYNLYQKLKKFKLKPCKNLVDLIWYNRLKPKKSEVFQYPIKYSGKTSKDKFADLKNFMQLHQLDNIILNNPQSICWLLNIRANDVEYMPILLSYILIHKNGNYILFSNDTHSLSLAEFKNYIKDIKNNRVLLDPANASYWLVDQFPNAVLMTDPCELARSIKNSVEIKQAKIIHQYDAIALCKFMLWLQTDKAIKDEYQVSSKLLLFRKQNNQFIGPSFASIVGFNGNGAIVHYKPEQENSKTIAKNGILLIDSGGHYFGGTTDITRVIAIGKASKEAKIAYTKVLKGHIALARAIFPIGTNGAQLDVLARYHLWQNYTDYGHGTGHGVGNCLSVHDGPQKISKFANQELVPGMILSNEPGYYVENKFGIRIENLLLVTDFKNGFLGFETISLVPFEKKLIVKTILDRSEIDWINSYHKQIRNKLLNKLNLKEQNFLLKATEEI